MKNRISFICISLLFLFAASSLKAQKFEVGKGTFLLNDKPFVIKAAEIHYPRIPREYWEHRIKMSKAMGMNTICLYVFWNFHESKEGKFDFTGQKDVAEFCRLAQRNNMYVIVRPGPYVCAEWEMGGLPWWLLKKKDIGLRVQDPYFMERVGVFMKEVGRQLSGLQISNGGNIIMVQVENEYGSYGTDKPYIAAIRDIVKASGFNKVPLFQCDWSSNFQNNALDDLLWTVNFGAGSNIDQQFQKLKSLRPESPLMCSEYWSGWFDHWGAKHETRSAASLTKGMGDMLQRNISFSLYMAHGGTSFGHWGGANFPNFSPTTTSYDYDAPINESGRTTPKFFEVRNLLQRYLPEGETLPAVPDSIPTVAIPAFSFTSVAPLTANLPKPVISEQVKSMEMLDQGWGSVLYRTTLPASNEPQTLLITEAHDWTQIFIDGKRIATLSRMKGENSVQLPPVKKGAVLDILVEAMGRMNFGKGIYDRKGITEKVEMKSATGTRELTGWNIYSIPTDYKFVNGVKYVSAAIKDAQPAFYKASFELSNTGDTFLDMRSWSKGMVWVNGHAIGRYWEIGPQQTLYVPGCWLKKGKNEVIVFDLSSPTDARIQGLRQPILNELRGNSAFVSRKDGQNLKLESESPLITGSFKPGVGLQAVMFSAAKKGRYLCIEALSSQQGDQFASIAELSLIGEDGKPLSRQRWRVIYADSEETSVSNNLATNIMDEQESTFWQTDYSNTKTPYPHQVVIDLGSEQVVTGFTYLPRSDNQTGGMIKDYRVFLKSTPYQF